MDVEKMLKRSSNLAEVAVSIEEGKERITKLMLEMLSKYSPDTKTHELVGDLYLLSTLAGDAASVAISSKGENAQQRMRDILAEHFQKDLAQEQQVAISALLLLGLKDG